MDHRNSLVSCLHLISSEPYCIFHFLTFFSYVVVRSSTSHVLSPLVTDRLLHREIQASLALSVLAVVKFVKEESWEAFISDTLLFAKGFLIALSLFMDYQLALWYLVAFLVTNFMTQQPAYEGLGTAAKLTPFQLESLLTEGNPFKFWLVEFRATCSSTCIRTSRFLPELSVTYSNKLLSFGIVDIGLFPNTAEKFGISLSGGMAQLPTYILFEHATEIARFPEIYFEEKIPPSITKIMWKKRILCHQFELDCHLIEYVRSGN